MPKLPPPIPSPKSERISTRARLIYGAGGTALVVALVLAAFSVAGVVDMTTAFVMLAVAWVIGTGAVFISEPILVLSRPYRLVIGTLSSFALGAVLLAIGLFIKLHQSIPAADAASKIQSLSLQPSYETPNMIVVSSTTNKGTLTAFHVLQAASSVTATYLLSLKEENDLAEKTFALLKTVAPDENEYQVGDGISFTNKFPMPKELYDEVVAGTRNLYVLEVITYQDSNSKTKHRVTELCRYFNKDMSKAMFCKSHTKIYTEE